MTDIVETFGCKAFDKKKLKKYMPKSFYEKWKNSVRRKSLLDRETADVIASCMKEWALENGAKYYCHWFQPLNGLSAQKLEAFLDRDNNYQTLTRFTGKELIKSEPDASSFPTGGMRSTFEARGYTYWDATANAFIIDDTMYIPSIFVSFNGQSLDKKGPLLNSINFLSEHATNLINLFIDKPAFRMRVKVGLEQEFFLIDRQAFRNRRDLVNTGRSLFGSKPLKAQEFSDHYFGAIPVRVKDFYKDVNIELEKLGIYPKTEHNEVAPCQFELAILFENANIAIDYNLMTMDVLKRVARKHELVCLTSEKPFNHINGSGKHNNWSLTTNYGLNCFESGKSDLDKARYSLFMSAVIKAVDEYPEILRLFSSCPGNDYRLGADEAPPAIISIFLGKAIEKEIYNFCGLDYDFQEDKRKIKINNLGYTPYDNSDRNRTSPFAFTGNKFEFRMLGSSMNASDVNTALNTMVGQELKRMYEKIKDSEDLVEDSKKLVKEVLQKHSRILFSGDGYSNQWKEEASKRGLANIKTYREAIEALKDKKNIELFENNGIFKEEELNALYDIFLEQSINTANLELKTFSSIIDQEIVGDIAKEITSLSNLLKNVKNKQVENKLTFINSSLEEIIMKNDDLKSRRIEINNIESKKELAEQLSQLTRQMNEIRLVVDEVENLLSLENKSLMTYEQIFSSIE